MKDATIHQTRTLAALKDISAHIISTLDYRMIANRCLASLAENLELERCALFMPTPDRRFLKLHAGIDWNEQDMKQAIQNIGKSPVGKVFSSGMSLAAPNANDIPDLYMPEFEHPSPHGVIGFIAVPVVVNRITIGVLSAYRVSHLTMIDEDVDVMKIVSSILSQTLKLEDMVEEANRKLRNENAQLHAELESRFHVANLVGNSQAMQNVISIIQKITDADATVLLRGESGTGKTVFAKAIHFSSKRKKMPFITVNCAAIPENLIESEMFGHEKGAFTGALNKRLGKFEAAEGGTIFLDEIGELSLEVQAKLLRIIQESIFERLGSNDTIEVDVRILCATNANLEDRIKKGTFREDLYYRLMVIPVYIPPLRNRQDDVLALVTHFLQIYNQKYNKSVSLALEGLQFLENYSWPGNVRELENTIERMVVLAQDDSTPIKEVPFLSSMVETKEQTESAGQSPAPAAPEQKERSPYERVPLRELQVRRALEESAGIQTLAAKKLGVSLRQLRYAVKKFNLDLKSFKY